MFTLIKDLAHGYDYKNIEGPVKQELTGMAMTSAIRMRMMIMIVKNQVMPF